MGLLDLLKDIPLSANLQEKLRTLEAKYAAAETENAILKDDKRQLGAETKRLKDEIKSLTHTDDLHETEIKILVRLADERAKKTDEALRSYLQLSKARFDYFLHSLSEKEYIDYDGSYYSPEPGEYYLSQIGREYLIKNDLI